MASATSIDNRGKVGILQRALAGLGVMGVSDVAIMPDSYHLGERSLRGRTPVDHPLPKVALLDMAVTERAQDSTDAAAMLREKGAACIIVLGGDGTVRVVSKTCGEVPLLPISTGTNNVLPSFVEGTIAGMAAGAVATGKVSPEGVAWRHKWLRVVVNGEHRDRVLIDVAVVRGRFVGARAIWAMHDLRLVAVTRAQPTSIGISAIAAMVRPIAPQQPLGLALTLAHEGDPVVRRVRAALGPGQITEVGISSVRELAIGEALEFAVDEPLVLALDGEREVLLHRGDQVALVLRDDGPWIIDSQQVMRLIVAQGLLNCD